MLRSRQSGTANSARPLLAALVLILALGLTAWRASAVFSARESATGASAAETALLSTLEAVAGEGAVRVTLNRGAGNVRTLFILLDESAPVDAAKIAALAEASAGLDFEAGERLIVETALFHKGFIAAADPDGVIEMGALALLVVCAGALFLTLKAERTEIQIPALPSYAPTAAPPPQSEPALRLAAVARETSAVQDAAALARRDPQRAAGIVRAWMNGRGDAA